MTNELPQASGDTLQGDITSSIKGYDAGMKREYSILNLNKQFSVG